MHLRRVSASRWRLAALAMLAVLVGAMVPRSGSADEPPGPGSGEAAVAIDDMWGDDNLVDPVSELGQRARGLYFNGPTSRLLGAAGIIRSVHSAGMNAVVLDLKDGQGRIIYKKIGPIQGSDIERKILPAVERAKAGG